MRRIEVFHFLAAPLIAVLILGGVDFLHSGGVTSVPAYIAFVYLIALVVGLPLLVILKVTRARSVVVFLLAGLLVASVATSGALGVVPGLNIDVDVWLSYLAQYWTFLAAGICASMYYWWFAVRNA
ncbi:hypothetical protein KUV95_17340 [Microbulbifer agarilyticus]|uniref:hypothetical protein n=1 Tax=Microbulbifer agarilyticus TaxID=260552 RepID=UPI001C94D722|nr:hypothetical protein [Microbulbifer agarilyticus]MBY6213309.1 hypothetical protein [Microbulbifer agarilyticus]